MNPRLRLLLGGCVALGVAFATWSWLPRNSLEKSSTLRELAIRPLAEYLKGELTDGQVLVLANPFIQDRHQPNSIRLMEEASIGALKEVLGDGRIVVGFPELRPGARENPQAFVGDPETTTPLSFLVAEDALDQLLRKHAGCKWIVSLIGLPVNLSRVAAWNAPGGPKFALLLPDLRVLGGTAAVRAAVKSGKLAAFVLNKPGAPADQSNMGPERQAEFEKRFLLVTEKNIDALINAHPALFEAPGALAR